MDETKHENQEYFQMSVIRRVFIKRPNQKHYGWEYRCEPRLFSNRCIKKNILTKLLKARLQWSEKLNNRINMWSLVWKVGNSMWWLKRTMVWLMICGTCSWYSSRGRLSVKCRGCRGVQQLQLLANWKKNMINILKV